MWHSNDLSLPLRDLCESLRSFEAALIPSAPSPLLRGALAGAPQDEAKAVEGRGHPRMRGLSLGLASS